MAPKRQKRRLSSKSDDDLDANELAASLEQRSKVSTSSQAADQEPSITRRRRSVALRAARNVPQRKESTAQNDRVPKPISEYFRRRGQTGTGQPKASKSQETQETDMREDKEDLIEDDSSPDDIRRTNDSHKASKSALDRRNFPTKPIKENSFAAFSQTIKLASRESGGIGSTWQERSSTCHDPRPWTEKYAPRNIEELAVHRRKVADVRAWLENVLSGQLCKKLLVLRGASGVGKTSTVHALAEDMSLDISEWRNPVGSEYASEGYTSMSAQFEEFLRRSRNFNELEIVGADKREVDQLISPEAPPATSRRKIVLLEEFPNTFASTSSSLRSFRSHVIEYLAAKLPHDGLYTSKPAGSQHTTPMIMIVTETRLTTSTAAHDSFTAHRLLSTEILGHPYVSIIDFNPIAPTLMSKALDLVGHKEAKQTGNRHLIGPSVLKQLGEVGDVRSAVGALEFLCLGNDKIKVEVGQPAAKTKTRRMDASTVPNTLKDSHGVISQRHSSLGLFHAVGKVVYNKRDDIIAHDKNSSENTQPPKHLAAAARARKSQVAVDQLIEETGTDVVTFIAALHENFTPSCAGPLFTETLNGCLDSLSDSDMIGALHRRKGMRGYDPGSNISGAASLRQDEIAFHAAVRGLIFALPDPVRRESPPIGIAGRLKVKGEAHKMSYPSSMRLLEQCEDVENRVDRWLHCIQRSTSERNVSTSNYKMPTFRSLRKGLQASRNPPLDSNDDSPSWNVFNCTKVDLLVERLPYVAMIERCKPNFGRLDELESITKFRGTEKTDDHYLDDMELDQGAVATEWSTDRSAEAENLYLGARPSMRKTSKEADIFDVPSVKIGAEQLFLIDDDIEDDSA